ncbi:glutarate-semialdehyde dehydrogenase [Condylostylus longicornis]|uniref:glutarate-semialdehyde dehydrogenase n=1 Tax=Condylostylus longicornis TaxID=2530218 RepID=UPI00244E3987|nr:glutarate-semialdehyde dehydrogenase [Condylostylus longicornis]
MIKFYHFHKIHLKKFTSTNWKRSISSLIQSKNFVGGNWITSGTGETFDVTNPATGNIIGSVPDMTVTEAEKAIREAKTAFASARWSKLTGKERSSLLKKWHTLIEENRNEIADIMTQESGKPISESHGEITYGNSFTEWFAEEARRIYGEVIPPPGPNRELFVLKQPIGVAALITPWNFPLAMITRKAAAALAAGCTVIIKPSEDTPLTALALAKLSEEAGFPNGTINILTTTKAANFGKLFCSSPDVDTISFTGSTEVGKILYRDSSANVKRISLELGGNAPFIVFNSADVEKAVEGSIVSKFRNCGQTCVSANRFFVQDGIYDSFMKALIERVGKLKIGPGLNTDTQIGPLINKNQFDKVKSFVDDASSKSAKILHGGRARKDIGNLFYEPTIVTNINQNMKLYTDEVFGPVISVIKFKTEEEAVIKANDTRRGLAGYFYSQDLSQIFRVAKALQVGMVGINEGLISTAEAPFGGVKESGIGREGSHHGIDEYVEVKYICLGNLKY